MYLPLHTSTACQAKIRALHGLCDGKEQSNESLKDVECAYDQEYESEEVTTEEASLQCYTKTQFCRVTPSRVIESPVVYRIVFNKDRICSQFIFQTK